MVNEYFTDRARFADLSKDGSISMHRMQKYAILNAEVRDSQYQNPSLSGRLINNCGVHMNNSKVSVSALQYPLH